MPIIEHQDPQAPQDLPADGETFNGRAVGCVAIIAAVVAGCLLFLAFSWYVTDKPPAELWQIVTSGWGL